MPLPQQYEAQDWTRWPQQQPADYHMMSTPPLLPFDTQAAPSGPEHKHIMSQALGPPYMMHGQYHSASGYDTAHRAPHYQHTLPFNYGQYPTPSPTAPLTPPFKPQNQQRLMSPVDAHAFAQSRDRPTPFHEPTSSPMIKCDPYPVQPSTQAQDILDGPRKEVNPIVPDDPMKKIAFNTPIDNLMRKYQSLGAKQTSASPSQLPTPATSPRHVSAPALPSRRRHKDRIFECSTCDYSSTQKAHLKAHMRTHTSELPYECEICFKRCSQKGNLEVHMRAHRGERVFKCDHPECDSAGFFSKSNLAAHKKIHQAGRPKWVCKFGNCTKSFSSIGNRKAHHNKFHEKEFARLSQLIDEFNKTGYCPEEDRLLVEELAVIYKNSNKGIKGRGKGVKVTKLPQSSPHNPVASLGWDHRGHPMVADRQMAVGSVSQMLGPVYHKPDINGAMPMMYRPGRDY